MAGLTLAVTVLPMIPMTVTPILSARFALPLFIPTLPPHKHTQHQVKYVTYRTYLRYDLKRVGVEQLVYGALTVPLDRLQRILYFGITMINLHIFEVFLNGLRDIATKIIQLLSALQNSRE